MKIQHIVEESVKVATDVAIHAANSSWSNFNHKIDILESKIFELKKLRQALKKELQDLKSEVKTRISSLQTKLGQGLQIRKHLWYYIKYIFWKSWNYKILMSSAS